MTKEAKWVEAGHKSWITRRANEAKRRRSEAARKAAENRRANAAPSTEPEVSGGPPERPEEARPLVVEIVTAEESILLDLRDAAVAALSKIDARLAAIRSPSRSNYRTSARVQ